MFAIYIEQIKNQIKQLYISLGFLYFPVLCFILGIFSLSIYLQIPFSNFTRDPVAVMETVTLFYVGMVSTVGGVIWGSTFVICLFSYFLLKPLIKTRLHLYFSYLGEYSLSFYSPMMYF